MAIVSLPRALFAFAFLLISVLVTPNLFAQHQPTGVIYSFTPQTVGSTQQYVLIPIATDQVRPDLSQRISISNAFNLLRQGKQSTYGGTALRLTDGDLANQRAVINIDPSRSDLFLIIAAETVYTFTQLGIEEVIFPGFAENGLTRADIPYGAYSVELPMWQVLPPTIVYETRIRLPNGETMPAEDFYPWIEEGSQEAQDAILLYLQSRYSFEILSVMAALPNLGIDNYESHLLGLMQNPDPNVREVALLTLVESEDNAAWNAIVSMMQNDAEPRLRSMATEALSRSTNDTYRAFIVFADAANGTIPDRIAAINELASMEDEQINAELLRYILDPEQSIREVAVNGLVLRQEFELIDSAMNNEELVDQARDTCAEALIEFGNAEQHFAALAFLTNHSTGLRATGLIDQINALEGIDQREAVEQFLRHQDNFVKTHVLGLLAERGNIDSLEAMAEIVENASPEVRLALDEAANQILASQTIAELREFAEDDDPFLQRSAYRALGTAAENGNATDDLFEMLVEGTQSTDQGIRGASARAIAVWANQEALDIIITLIDDSSILVQADVARALGYFGDEEFLDQINPLIAANIQSGEPEIIAGGLDAVARLGREQLLPIVLEYVDHENPHVRASAMRAAADIVPLDRPRPVINSLTGGLRDEVAANRIIAARLLGRFDHELAVLGISQVLNETNEELRFAAISALSATGNRQAPSVLAGLLEDPSAEIKLAALEAIVSLNYNYVIVNIERSMSYETDPEVLAAEQEAIRVLTESGR